MVDLAERLVSTAESLGWRISFDGELYTAERRSIDWLNGIRTERPLQFSLGEQPTECTTGVDYHLVLMDQDPTYRRIATAQPETLLDGTNHDVVLYSTLLHLTLLKPREGIQLRLPPEYIEGVTEDHLQLLRDPDTNVHAGRFDVGQSFRKFPHRLVISETYEPPRGFATRSCAVDDNTETSPAVLN